MSERAVLLCGQSLLMPMVAASLEQSRWLCVTRATTWREATNVLVECTPDVLILDLADTCASCVLLRLFSKPQLMLVRLDTERNQAVLLSGQEARSLTLEGLRDIVYGREK